MTTTETKAAVAVKATAAGTEAYVSNRPQNSIASPRRRVKAAVRREVVWPAWPRRLAHVESASTPGHWHVVDLDAGSCDCRGHTYRGTCTHEAEANADYAAHAAADVAQAEAARRSLLALMAEYGEPVWFVETEVAA